MEKVKNYLACFSVWRHLSRKCSRCKDFEVLLHLGPFYEFLMKLLKTCFEPCLFVLAMTGYIPLRNNFHSWFLQPHNLLIKCNKMEKLELVLPHMSAENILLASENCQV